ncbi:hypothetical protein VNI00_006131 [Paramarasmius palmivorus]|uniref:F-box domain-containing protein n=1 Tax=Paramarasmius palmivorus TaxID=297713 RepID=A0AAW0D7Y3_9AGAR
MEIVGTLKAQRSALCERVGQRRSLLSSLRKMPPEILCHIFILVHDSSDYSLELSRHRRTRSNASYIVSLSQVSSHWRQMTLSLPELWSSIAVDVGFVREEDGSIIDTHLRNAGTHPLKLRIQRDIVRYSYPSVDALWMIVKDLHRCEKLDLVNIDGKVLDKAFQERQLPRLSFPHLRSYGDASSRLGYVSEFSRWIWEALCNAPKLVRLYTSYFHDPATSGLPYHQLTTVHIISMTPCQILNVVRATSSLEALVIIPFRSDPEPELSAMLPVVCSSLQTISINIAGYLQHRSNSQFQSLLALLRMPALKRLEVQVLLPSPLSFFPMIQYSSGTLQEIVWNSDSESLFESESLQTLYTDIVQSLPNLRSFRAFNEGTTALEHVLRLIRMLTITSSQPVLAPQLTTLHLAESSAQVTVDYTIEFLDMIESRDSLGERVGVARLVDAKLEYRGIETGSASEGGYSVEERIEKLAKRGVRCELQECESNMYV